MDPNVPATLSRTLLRLIDDLCDRFESSWQLGPAPVLEEVLPLASEEARPQLFRELLRLEREYRSQQGRPLGPEEARRRFAGLGTWAVAALSAAGIEEPADRKALAVDTNPSGVRGWGEKETSPISQGLPSTSPASMPFLRPPQAPGEMGRLGVYPVFRVLGKGGMGVVLLAEDPGLLRRIALKVMQPREASEPQARERFLREARAMAAVKSDYVVTVHQVGEADGVPFVAMELLAGESLAERLSRESPPVLGRGGAHRPGVRGGAGGGAPARPDPPRCQARQPLA